MTEQPGPTETVGEKKRLRAMALYAHPDDPEFFSGGTLIKWGFVGLTAGLGAYFGSYLKAKGQNVASREDFEDLKRQTAALAQTTISCSWTVNERRDVP